MRLHALVLGILVVSGAACQASPEPTAATRTITVTIPVPVRDKVVSIAAADVFSKRLKALGVGNFTVSTGDTMRFVMLVPLTFDSKLVDEVLHRPGDFEFIPWPPDAAPPAAGDAVPATAMPLFDTAAGIVSGEVSTDSSGIQALAIKLSPVGSEAIGTFTTQHVGGYLPLILDGRVLAAPIINSPITAGDLRIVFVTTEPPEIPLASLAAMMTSGPLPDAWTAQP
jgi:preprotein translocase subunit SecD